MILHFSFEELAALDAVIERVREASGRGGVAAPAEVLPDIEALAPRLTGDFALRSLGEQQSVQRAIEYMLAESRDRADAVILNQHPAAEEAVLAYFEFAHVLTVLDRVRQIGAEMRAIIELTTGHAPSDTNAREYTFED
jgi:hypothetical protein